MKCLPFIKPMEPIPRKDLIEDARFIYQVKWDGVRMLAFVNHGQVRLINRKQHERTQQYPELTHLADAIAAECCILDGEMVVLKNQRPHFPSIMQRDNCRAPSQIASLSQVLPVHYVIFDLLQVNYEDLTRLPLWERRTRLNTLINPNKCPGCYLIEDFPVGQSLFEAVQSSHLEGVVAKALDSIYQSGRAHQAWFKIKCRQEIQCIVGGYLVAHGRIKSLLLGIEQNGILLYVGRASTGLKEDDWHHLYAELPHWLVDRSPFGNWSISVKSSEIHFVKPCLGVQIEFQEWTDHMQLRSPVIKGFCLIEPPQPCPAVL